MRTTIPDDLAAAFPQSVLDAFVGALRALYDNIPTSDEFAGFDNTCFGLALYRMAPEELRPALRSEGHSLKVRSEDNAWVYELDGVTFSCQRVGSTSDVEIRRAFPRNYRAPLHGMYGNDAMGAWLPFPGLDRDREASSDAPAPLVLAHVGNEEDGLLAAYLCQPRWVENGHIRSWGFAVPLLECSGGTGVASARGGPAPDVPPAEQIGRAAVRRKSRLAEEGAE